MERQKEATSKGLSETWKTVVAADNTNDEAFPELEGVDIYKAYWANNDTSNGNSAVAPLSSDA